MQQCRYGQSPFALFLRRLELFLDVRRVQSPSRVDNGAVERQLIGKNDLKQRAIATDILFRWGAVGAHLMVERESVVPLVFAGYFLVTGFPMPVERCPGKPRVTQINYRREQPRVC